MNELIATLRAAVEFATRILKDRGLTQYPRAEYEITWWHPTASGARAERARRSEPSLWNMRDVAEIIYSSNEYKKFEETATEFIKNHGRQQAYHWIPPDDSAALLFLEYFIRVGDLSIIENVVAEICQEFVRDWRADETDFRIVLHVESFEAAAPFMLADSIEFRPIRQQDIDQYGRVHFSEQPEVSEADWIGDIRLRLRKDERDDYEKSRDLLDRIIGALNLTVEGRSTFTFLSSHVGSRFLRFGEVRRAYSGTTSRRGGKISLSEADIQRFRAMYGQVSAVYEQATFEDLRLPLRRLRLASARYELEDQLVDYVIGLERLLAVDSPQLEVTFRFRLRGAALLKEQFGTPRERINLLNQLYRLRSDVVHGSVAPGDLQQAVPEAEKVLKAILKWHIENRNESSVEARRRGLDEALVVGGTAWAYLPPN